MQTVQIEWKETARQDAQQILTYIAQDNVAAAFGVLDDIEHQVGQLAEYPKLGRVGRVKGTRELVVSGTPYIVVYAIGGKKQLTKLLTIVRILHGAQQWPPTRPCPHP